MVSDYVKRVLIVDDQEQDIAFLRDALNELNVLIIYKDPKISNLVIE